MRCACRSRTSWRKRRRDRYRAGEALGLDETLAPEFDVPVLGQVAGVAAAGATLWAIGSDLFGSEATPTAPDPYPAHPVLVEPGPCPARYSNCWTMTSANVSGYTGPTFHFIGSDPSGGLISSSLAQVGQWSISLDSWVFGPLLEPDTDRMESHSSTRRRQRSRVLDHTPSAFRKTTAGGTPSYTSSLDPSATTGTQILNRALHEPR